jgi:hypothetical protein
MTKEVDELHARLRTIADALTEAMGVDTVVISAFKVVDEAKKSVGTMSITVGTLVPGVVAEGLRQIADEHMVEQAKMTGESVETRPPGATLN